MTVEIRANTELPARREPITLHTSDGLSLVGEWALPLDAEPRATVVTFHPLPTAGGFMESHTLTGARRARHRCRTGWRAGTTKSQQQLAFDDTP
jgi:hypothetical protein